MDVAIRREEENQTVDVKTAEYTHFEVTCDKMDNGKRESMSRGDVIVCEEVSAFHLYVGGFYVLQVGNKMFIGLVSDLKDGIAELSYLNKAYPCRLIELSDIEQAYRVMKRWPIAQSWGDE